MTRQAPPVPPRSTLLIGALWALSICSAVQGAYLMPLPDHSPQMSSAMMATLLALPVLFFGAMSFWMSHSPFYHPALARFVDTRLGAHALEGFLVRLKPLLMFATTAVLQGLAGLWHGYTTGAAPGAYFVPGFMLSGGVGFALVHVVLRLRRVVGVYSTGTIREAGSLPAGAGPRRTSLRDALRAYWWTLIGVVLFPTAAVLAGELLDLAFEYFVLPFLAVALLAAWPHLSGRAPYSFWLVATGVWLVGGVLAFTLLELLHLLGLA